jgi:hypothetical protein
MTEGLRGRIFALFLGPLIGYITGWILGWNAVDPNMDVWALAAALGAFAGLGIALTRIFWRVAGSLLGMAVGLFAGWVLKAILFGDQTSGLGLLIVVAGGLFGLLTGMHPMFRRESRPLRILVTALLAGFFGGFFLNVLILRLLLGWIQSSSVLTQAPGVFGIGILAAIIASVWHPMHDNDPASATENRAS